MTRYETSVDRPPPTHPPPSPITSADTPSMTDPKEFLNFVKSLQEQ